MNILRAIVRNVLPALISAALIAAAWDIAIRIFDIKKFVAPTPYQMIVAVAEDASLLSASVYRTGKASLIGLCFSVLAGVAIGVLFSKLNWIRRALFPYAVCLQTVPIVAMAPLLVLWDWKRNCGGSGGGLHCQPFSSHYQCDRRNAFRFHWSLAILFALYDANRWQTFCKLEFPATMPHFDDGGQNVRWIGGNRSDRR